MFCPSCNAPLQVVTRHDVAIDRCPSCRGVWLDRGELDRLMDRAAESESRRVTRDWDWDDDDVEERARRDRRVPVAAGRAPAVKRRRNFLSEIFDFD